MRVLEALKGHFLVKADVGLANVDDTSDVNKPVSTAQAAAIALKADTTALTAHTSDTANPHAVTKAQVGLGSVDNTSDAAKPVSTAQAAAIALKADDAATTTALAGKQPLDSDLTAIAALAPADGSLMGRAGGAWVGRSPANAKTDLSLDKVLNIKHNIAGTTAPTVGNNATQGYSAGSWWFDVSNANTYLCYYADASTAVWFQMNSNVTTLAASAPLAVASFGNGHWGYDYTVSLPAAAGPSTNGYMTGADKARLDGLYAPVLIAEGTIGVGGASGITFSSIPQTYRDLLLTWSIMSDGLLSAMYARFNGDTGANYDWQRDSVTNATFTPTESVATTTMRIGSYAPSFFSSGEARIYEYTRTDRGKMIVSLAGRVGGTTTGNFQVERDMSYWRTTNAAITSVTTLGDSNYAAGSIVRLFGLP